MFERYRNDARRAIFFARHEALMEGSSNIDTRHLFMGLLYDQGSRVNQLFGLAAFRNEFRRKLQISDSPHPVQTRELPLALRSKRALAYTAEEAERLNSQPIGTEHLLLGLLRESKSDLADALTIAGVDIGSVRKRIRADHGLPLTDTQKEKVALQPMATFLLLAFVLIMIYVFYRLITQ